VVALATCTGERRDHPSGPLGDRRGIVRRRSALGRSWGLPGLGGGPSSATGRARGRVRV